MQGWTLAVALAAFPALGAGPARAAETETRLSVEATRGYLDIELARLAIFDGRIADARRLVAEAAAAFDKAKDDPSVFLKAESALRAPAVAAPVANADAGGQSPADAEAEAAAMNRAKQENSARVYAGGAPDDAAAAAANAAAEERAAAAANAAKQETSAKAYAGGVPLRWLPVDAEMGLPNARDADQAAAVAAADARLGAGDRPGALAALRRAGLRPATVVGVLPLDQTRADVGKAAALVEAGKYLEASQLLRHVQDTVRYDASGTSADSGGR